MVAQIIVSREDSTSFFSLGSVQDDASLVSALGGALASFAVEMGLSDIGTSNANYSKFQNGVLISKWLEIGNYKPSLMIAIRNFDNLEQYHHIFLLDYGTFLAKKLLLKFEKLYSSSGEIPRFDDVLKFIPEIANDLYKDSPNTLKEFTSTMEDTISKGFTDLWENQSDKGICPFSFRNFQYSPEKIAQISNDFTQYYYRQGAINDALFPLYFASSPDFKNVNKKLSDFLNAKAKASIEEIADEIKRIIKQLGEMSSSRTRRKRKIEIESVDLLNADLIFENIAIAPTEQLDKTRAKILDELYTTLLLKLYQLYPLKFLAASHVKPIDITFIQDNVEKSIQPLIKETLANTERISTQISSILREITSDYTPEEALKNKDEILAKVHDRFIKQIKKDDPFIILADSGLEKTLKLVKKLASEAFEQYRTAHDEAMALWYIVRQINSSVSKLKTTSINSIVQIEFLQELIRKYQFRTIPDIVFRISIQILEELVSSPSSKGSIITLLEKNITSFEKQVQFSIPTEIKNSLIKKFKTITTSKQTTDNIETLSFFSRAFSLALESSIVFILEMFFGKNNFPHPPEQLSEAVEKIVLTSQGLYSLSKIMHILSSYSSAQDLFSSETENILVKALGYSSVVPSPYELMKIAYDFDWIIEYKESKESTTKTAQKTSQASTKKDSSEIKDTVFLTKKVSIPSLKITDQVSSLVQDPLIITELWVLYGERAFQKRLESVRKYIKNLETKQKTTAGAANGKKRVEGNLRKAKTVAKTLQQYIVGGKLIHRIFSGKKGLKNLIITASKERFPGLNYFPENFTINTNEGIIYGQPLSKSSFSVLGGFKKLTEIYASTWVRDSEYIRKLKEEILWRVLEKKSQKSTLENKILENLQNEAAKSGRVNQETIVRNTIENEVSLHYRKIVRETINLAFDSIKDDLIVRIDNDTKDNYLTIDSFDIDIKYLSDYNQLKYMRLVKVTSDRTELRLNLTELLPAISSKKKSVQTVRLYIRDGLKEIFKSKQFKALAILGELVDAYIGEQAVDLFFSKSSVFEQLILESIDKS